MSQTYRYKGDIKKLIPAGWKFHKLFARNYKAYNKDGVWMFVKGGLVIEPSHISTLRLGNLVIKHVLDNLGKPDSFWLNEPNPKGPAILRDYRSPKFVTWRDRLWSKKHFKRLRTGVYKRTGQYIFSEQTLDIEFIRVIQELSKLGEIILD